MFIFLFLFRSLNKKKSLWEDDWSGIYGVGFGVLKDVVRFG